MTRNFGHQYRPIPWATQRSPITNLEFVAMLVTTAIAFATLGAGFAAYFISIH